MIVFRSAVLVITGLIVVIKHAATLFCREKFILNTILSYGTPLSIRIFTQKELGTRFSCDFACTTAGELSSTITNFFGCLTIWMIVGDSDRGELTIIDYHAPFEQGFSLPVILWIWRWILQSSGVLLLEETQLNCKEFSRFRNQYHFALSAVIMLHLSFLSLAA